LTESGTLEEIVVLGSKLKPLSVIGSARPIQRVSKTEIERSGFISLTESLNGQVPSFHSTFQTISDGTDHITPSSLRGLGPDQLLVLVNGKRRHHSSLLNINGTTGRGSVSTDLNAIPLIAIEDIEVLSEDAVALYGSDAIGGVINIKLKENQNYSEIRALSGITQKGDGQNYQLGGIVGIELGSKGQLNVSMDFRKNEPINRAGRYTGPIFGDDRDEDEQEIQNFYNQTGLPYGKVMEIGAGGSDNAGLFLNLEYPIKDNLEFYLSSGVNYRLGKSRGFYRFPYQERRQSGLFPYGFSPILKTHIWDQSSIIGLRRQQNGWNIDLSNTYGSNTIGFHVANSNNASLGLKSPIEGHVGGFKYFQNVTNFDAKSNRKNMDFGFGFEFKMEASFSRL